jgi:hypothetical protein
MIMVVVDWVLTGGNFPIAFTFRKGGAGITADAVKTVEIRRNSSEKRLRSVVPYSGSLNSIQPRSPHRASPKYRIYFGYG